MTPRRWGAVLACLALLTAGFVVLLGTRSSDSRADAGSVRVSANTAECRDAPTWLAAQAAPLCSIAKAVQLAPPGARILVAAGSYPALTLAAGKADWVTIAADGSGAVNIPNIVLAPGANHISFSGLTLNGPSGTSTFSVQAGVANVQLLGSSLHSTSANAVDLAPGSADLLFQGNTVTTAAGYGIVFNATSTAAGSPAGGRDDPPIQRVTIRHNLFDGVDGDAVRPAAFRDVLVEGNEFRNQRENGDHVDALQVVWGGANLTFRGNYLHDNHSQGLFIKDGAVTGLDVENNVMVRNPVPCANCGDVQLFLTGVTNAKVINNTIWDNGTNVTLYTDVQNLELRNNLFAYMDVEAGPTNQTASWTQERNIIAGGNKGTGGPDDLRGARPAFVDAGGEDYRLRAGSAGIDAGSATDAPAVDKACAARYDAPNVANTGRGSPSYIDLGALEWRPDSTAADTASPNTGACPAAAPTPPPAAPATNPPPAAGAPAPAVTKGGSTPATTQPCTCRRDGRGHCRTSRITRSRRGIALRLSTTATCRVRVTVRAHWRTGRARTLRRRLTLRAGQRTTLQIPLPIAARRRLAHGHAVAVSVTVVGVTRRGYKVTSTGSATFRR